MNNGVRFAGGRLLCRLGLLLIMLGVLAPLSILPAAAQDHDEGLDLPAMVLTPWDLADAGLERYGHTVSETLSLEAMVDRLAAEGDVPDDDMRDALEDAGFVRAYYAWYSPPAEEGEDVSDHAVVSYLFEFEDDDGAVDAWDYLENDADDSTGEDLDGFDDFGDASEASLIEGGSSAAPYLQLDVTVLTDNLHVGMAVIDWTGDEPDEDVAAELIEFSLERVEDGLDADLPALSNMVVRLAGDDVTNFYDMYLLRDGEAIWTYRETPDDAESDLEEAEDAGITEKYRVWQQIAAGSDEMAGSVLFYLTLVRFEDEDAAEAFVAEHQEGIEEDENYTDIETDAADYGDGGFAYSAVTANGAASYSGITFQLGDIVAIIDLGGPIMPSEDAVTSLADEQLTCLDDGGCPDPIDLPADLEDYVDEVIDSSED